jgi:ribose transport system ATP-binding protein
MLQLQNISKHFGGVHALKNVSLHFEQGKIHALCGENGAGKSTLMNIIMGVHQPDEGVILWNGQQVHIRNVPNAHRLGISIVYQERTLVASLSIAENIFPVNLPVTKTGMIDFDLLFKKTRQLLQELGLANLSPKILVSKLSSAQKQMIEIAKAIAQKPSLLILDEPTASITHYDTEILFSILRKLKEKGVGIIYISHRMAEIELIADTVSVLKDGKFVATVEGNTPAPEIIRLMVGRDLETVSDKSNARHQIKFEVQNINGRGFAGISFQLHEGEVLGFAGLQGSGRSAMVKALIGDESITSGKILKNGQVLHITHPSDAVEHGIVYIPEDRKTEGLFLHQTVAENISSAHLRRGFYDNNAVNKESRELCQAFGVRTPAVTQQMRKLSGGNQQKTMLAKWISLQPEILIVNEPTHGVDVGSKSEIYRLLKELTAEGKSILLISSDLSEVLLLSDRIAVMHEGKMQAILDRAEATEEKIVVLASGINDQYK